MLDREKFLKDRKNYIGASDAPIIMGVSPWRTQYQLWQDKLDLVKDEPTSYAMQRGIDMEPIARAEFIKQVGIDVQPMQVVHKNIYFMMANFDGISSDMKTAVEIKCPGELDHEKAKNGEVPEKYYPQLQHQMAVANLDEIHYFSFRDGEGISILVDRDERYVKRLYKEERKFWDCVENLTAPKLTNRDYTKVESDEWLSVAKMWIDTKRKIKELEQEEEIFRTRLISLSQDKSCVGGGITTQKITKKGSVDYKSIPELKDIDLEKYRKPSRDEWRIKEC